MYINQISISHIDYNKHWTSSKTKIMVYKEGIFLSSQYRKKSTPFVVRI